MQDLTAGLEVQTPFGKGIVQEVLNGGRVRVAVQGRLLVLPAAQVRRIEASARARRKRGATEERGRPPASAAAAQPQPQRGAVEIDLHGLLVEEALDRAERALNDAMLADRAEVRLIHGKGSGRIRAALHRRLQQIASVRAFRIDPSNDGVTVVYL